MTYTRPIALAVLAIGGLFALPHHAHAQSTSCAPDVVSIDGYSKVEGTGPFGRQISYYATFRNHTNLKVAPKLSWKSTLDVSSPAYGEMVVIDPMGTLKVRLFILRGKQVKDGNAFPDADLRAGIKLKCSVGVRTMDSNHHNPL